MKVSLIHPERRTLQSIALEAAQMPKKLRPTQRHELTIARGGALEFIAGIGGKKQFGAVPLLIMLEPEEGEAIQQGCVCYSRVVEADAERPPVFVWPTQPMMIEGGHSAPVCSVYIDLKPDHDFGVVIANPIEPLQVQAIALEGAANG